MIFSPFPSDAGPGKLESPTKRRALRMLGEPLVLPDNPVHAHPEQTMDNRPDTREAGRIYIDELCGIVNRKPDTIRKWERSEMLPAHLMPKRGTREWRYWTDKQVYGPRGILWWMKKNDIRPGAYLTTPQGEATHIAHMRRPRGISAELLNEMRYVATSYKTGSKTGRYRRTRKWIIDHYWPLSSYSSKANFEKAISGYFAQQGWEFPPPVKPTRTPARPKKRASSRMTKAQIKRHPEVRRLTREANRIVRIVDKKLAKGK